MDRLGALQDDRIDGYRDAERGKRLALVAIDGNSLIRDKNHMTIPDQYDQAAITTHHIADMIRAGPAQNGVNLTDSHFPRARGRPSALGQQSDPHQPPGRRCGGGRRRNFFLADSF
jgi:hypothetical protein